MTTHALLKSLRNSRFAPAVPSESIPKSRGVSKWTGFKKVTAPKIQAAPLPRRRSPMDRNERARLARLLECYNRQTRERGTSGRRNQGALKASGVEIAKALLFDHLNMKTGQLDPSTETLARNTGWSARTIQRARDRLRASGILSWVRRSRLTTQGWKPTSNLYSIGQLRVQTTSRFIYLIEERPASPPCPTLLGLAASLSVCLHVDAS